MALQQPISALILAIAATLFLAGSSTGFQIHDHHPGDDLQFVIEACNSTLNPSLCISNLSPYARDVNKNQRELAISSITVGLAAASKATQVLSEMRERMTDSAALSDCLTMVSDSSSQMKDSIEELKHLNKKERQSQIANVQTWLSAALTNEKTCMDGLTDLAGKDKEIVDGSMGFVTDLTSNALALVNRFADTI